MATASNPPPPALPADFTPGVPGVEASRIPRHVAIIMDGNGRWAQSRGFPREFGHRAGLGAVREVVTGAIMAGVRVLTLYSFSLENWKRPREEVDALMRLGLMYLEGEASELARQGIALRILGRRQGLPQDVLDAADRATAATAHGDRLTLCLAANYGSRAEIADAARSLARDAAAGRLDPDSIDESSLASRLYTAGLPDPDLLVRTAGEMRVSNYLLWQISYAEIHVTNTLWPDFGREDLFAAIRDYASRSRRFGGLVDQPAGGTTRP